MTARQHATRVLWPVLLMGLSLGLLLFQAELGAYVGDGEMLFLVITSLAYFAAAWLVSRVLALVLDQTAGRRRPYPRLLNDLIAGGCCFCLRSRRRLLCSWGGRARWGGRWPDRGG